MSSEDLCAVDYVMMLLLEKFKGKVEVDRLESYLNKRKLCPASYQLSERYLSAVAAKKRSEGYRLRARWRKTTFSNLHCTSSDDGDVQK